MKKVWLDCRNWKKNLVTTAIENGVDAVLVNSEDIEKVKALGLISVIADDQKSDLRLGKDVLEITIKNKKDEERIASLTSQTAIVDSQDWTIIPLENIIAQGAKVVFPVTSMEDAKVALTILEKGVWGVLVRTDNPAVVKKLWPLPGALVRSLICRSLSSRMCKKFLWATGFVSIPSRI